MYKEVFKGYLVLKLMFNLLRSQNQKQVFLEYLTSTYKCGYSLSKLGTMRNSFAFSLIIGLTIIGLIFLY